MSSAAHVMKVSPQTLPGSLHQQNQTAFDWGCQGLVAYASHNTVVVIDPRSIQPLQTLSAHKTNVIKLRWSSECHHHTLVSPYTLRLASVDSGSHCIVWDVNQGAVSAEFSLGAKPLVDLQWLHTNDSCRDLLAVMLNPSSITIWNASTGTKVSRFTFTETIVAFVFNPFQLENLILLSPECFIFVNDFNPSRNPSGGGKKFYLSTGAASNPPLPGRGKSPLWLQRKLLSSNQLKGEETVPLVDCIQVAFSQSNRHHLFIVYPKEVVIMDVEIKQTVGVISVERNASPFLYLMPCRQRDLIYCLHENGCVSVRVQQPLQLPTNIPMSPFDAKPREVRYELHGHSEPLRISKTCQVYTGGVCPISEKRVAVLTSEGRILFWDIEFERIGVYGEDLPKEVDSYPTLLTSRPLKGARLVNITQDEGIDGGVVDGCGLTLADTIAPHWFTPPEGCMSTYGLVSLKLILGGLWSSISSTPTVVRMCPPLTTKNWLFYAPLVAVGTSNGSVLIFNLLKRILYKELAVHSCCIHGIEWISGTSFATYAYTSPNTTGHVRNEIAITDIQAGKVTYLKRPDESESINHTPIDTIKISLHKNYLVVKYKDRPLEFWDARSQTFLRELVSNPPSFSCVEWSPSPKPAKTQKAAADLLTFGASVSTVDFDVAMGTSEHKPTQATGRELLTVMDETGCMWQISIEGSKVRVVNGQPTQTWLSNPMCVTWKGELMVAGDSEGVLIVLDAKTSQARTIETPKAPVKKIRFAPGKGNTKIFVLYTTRFDIREVGEEGLISQLKWGGREAGSHLLVEDADWATSDKPVLLTGDGCVRVFDIKLQHCQSAVTISDFAEPVFCPYAVPPPSVFRLKVMLQHQPWRLEYNLNPSDLSETDPVEKFVRAQLEVMPEEYRVALEETHLGTAERCLLTANLFGDEQEVGFWTVALYYMLREKNRLQDPRYKVYKYAHRRNPSSDIIRPDSEASISIGAKSLSSSSKPGQSLDDLLGPVTSDLGIDSDGDSLPLSPPTSLDLPALFDPNGKDIDAVLKEVDARMLVDTPPLDLNWDLLCDSNTFKRIQLDRALLHDSKRQTYDQTKKCAETLLLQGQTDRAVQLLLETDSSNPDYYTDALKACLAATIRSSGASQSTIKLVATNLIANSKLLEGVQLLCLIDKGQDACRYLQTYGEWQHSVWLAKSTLNEKDVSEVFLRWADHLTSVGVNQKSMALLVMLSLGKFYKVIEMLYSMRHFDQAAVFTESCLEYKLVKNTEETAPLIEAVFLEYARYLNSLSWTRGMRYYCEKAGENGEKLFQQLHKQST